MRESILEWQDKLSKILFEDKSVSGNEVTDAITNKYRVVITYDDETEKRRIGSRLIEPYVYGLTKAGNEAIRAFQHYGATRRGVPKYKLFRLDRIKSWIPKTEDHFFAEPKKIAISTVDYNQDGDKGMSMIFAQVSFNGSNKEKTDINQNTEPQEWESPLERIRRQKEELKQRIANSPKINAQGSVNTKALDKELNTNKQETNFETDIDSKLGVSPQGAENTRGAINISDKQYDRDRKSKEDKRTDRIMRRRDDRWEKAADERPLWRKGSANAEMQQDEENNL